MGHDPSLGVETTFCVNRLRLFQKDTKLQSFGRGGLLNAFEFAIEVWSSDELKRTRK